MLGLKQQHDFGREIGQSPQRMESHSLERHPDRWIAPVYPFFVRRFLEHHLEGWFGLSAPIHIDLMNWLFETLAGIRERGVSILLVEQRAQMTIAFADRTHVIANGRLRLTLGPGDAGDTERLTAAYLS